MAQKSLKKQFVSLSKDSLIYGIGNAITAIIFFLMAPVLTRVFSPSEYGVISLINSTISFLNLFLIFGMDSAVFITFYQYKNQKKEIISGVFWFLSIWAFLLIGIALAFSKNISGIMFHEYVYQMPIFAALSSAFFNLLINFSKTVFRLEFRAKTFAVVTGVNAILSIGLSIVFVVFLKQGIWGYFLGSLIGVFISFILAIWLVRKMLVFKIYWPRLKENIGHGAAIVPASFAYFIFNLSDRFFVNKYWGLNELGLYAIAININSILAFFSVAVGRAWAPFVLKMYHDSKRTFSRFLPRALVYYLIGFFILAVIISTFRQEILMIFTVPKFFGASRAIGILSLGMVFSATTQVTCLGFYISKKTKKMALAAGLTAVFNTLLNFALIPRYGMVGASWATALSYLFLTVSYLWYGQKLAPIRIDWIKVIKLIAVAVIVIFVSPRFWHYSFLINLAIKVLQFLLFFIFLYVTGVFTKSEFKEIKNILGSLKDKFKRKGKNEHGSIGGPNQEKIP